MSKRKKKPERLRSGQHPRFEILFRPVLMSLSEVEWLIKYLEHNVPEHRLLVDLYRTKEAFEDWDTKQKELAASELANAFWLEDKGTEPAETVQRIGNAAKERRRLVAEQMEAMSPEEIEAIIKEELRERKINA